MNPECNSAHKNKTHDFTIDENAVDSSTMKNENFNDIEIRLNSKLVLPPRNNFQFKKCSTMEYTLTPITQISINLEDTNLNATPPSSRSTTPPSSRSFSHGKSFFFRFFVPNEDICC